MLRPRPVPCAVLSTLKAGIAERGTIISELTHKTSMPSTTTISSTATTDYSAGMTRVGKEHFTEFTDQNAR